MFMASDDTTIKAAILNATADITAAYVAANKVPLANIADVIETIYGTLDAIANSSIREAHDHAQIDIASSITPEYLICLEDGKRLKMLKRYLKTNYNMTPEEYRKRWNLPADYPMVAPNYALKRSELAKDIGLGKQSVRQRKQVMFGKFKGGLPAGKGKLRIVRSTDIMTTRSVVPY
jgi:predicted transcriptional regulator